MKLDLINGSMDDFKEMNRRIVDLAIAHHHRKQPKAKSSGIMILLYCDIADHRRRHATLASAIYNQIYDELVDRAAGNRG